MRIVLKDEGDRPLRREGSSSETEGSVLKHPRIKAKRRQGTMPAEEMIESLFCLPQIVKDLRKGDLHSEAKGSYADRKLLAFSTHEVELATLKGRV